MSLYWESVLTTASIFAIAAIGLRISLGTGQFSVMHGALLGVGAYAGGFAAKQLGLSLIPSLVVATLAAAVLAALVSALLLRLSGLFFGIATLAIGEGLSITARTFFPGGAQGYTGVPLRTTLPVAALILVLLLAALTRLRASRTGLGILAAGADPVAAGSLGIAVARMKVWSFAVGGGIAGLAGGLLVQFLGLVLPADLSFPSEIRLLMFVIIGGMSTAWGAVAGAFLIIVGEELLRVATLDRFWLLGLLLVIVILARPQGLLSRLPLRSQGGVGLLRPGARTRGADRALEPDSVSKVTAGSEP